MKSRNYHYWGSVEKVNSLLEDYRFLGRSAKIVEPGHLVVFALPPKEKKEKKEHDKKDRVSRKNTYSTNK